MDTIHYMLDNAGYLASLTFQHLWLVALAVGLAIIIGVPLGVLIRFSLLFTADCP